MRIVVVFLSLTLFLTKGLLAQNRDYIFTGYVGIGGKFLSGENVKANEFNLGVDILKRLSKKKWTPFAIYAFISPNVMFANYSLPNYRSRYSGNHLFFPIGVRLNYSPFKVFEGKEKVSIFLDMGLRARLTLSSQLDEDFFDVKNSFTKWILVSSYSGNPYKDDLTSAYYFFRFGLEYRRIQLGIAFNYNLINEEISNLPVSLKDTNIGSFFYYNYNKHPFGEGLICIGYTF